MGALYEMNQDALSFEKRVIEYIKYIRVMTNISQSELARKSGVPQKTISRMENGLSIPSLQTLYKLVNAMGYTMEFQLKK